MVLLPHGLTLTLAGAVCGVVYVKYNRRHPDWVCPFCAFKVYGSKASCRCGRASRPGALVDYAVMGAFGLLGGALGYVASWLA